MNQRGTGHSKYRQIFQMNEIKKKTTKNDEINDAVSMAMTKFINRH